MLISFSKYEGAGNDFIMIAGSSLLSKEQITSLCHRNLGIGADGVIFVAQKSKNQIVMTYYNADGSYAAFCGNGARCAVSFANENFRITESGILWVGDLQRKYTIISQNIIKIELGEPENVKRDITLTTLNRPVCFVNTGVEHVCLNYSHLPKDEFNSFDIEEPGKKIRYHDYFAPIGTNVNFYWRDEDDFLVRTYERGVEGETLACGTGATAVAYLEMLKSNDFTCKSLKTKSGLFLKVSFENSALFLEGPAKRVFKGEINLD